MGGPGECPEPSCPSGLCPVRTVTLPLSWRVPTPCRSTMHRDRNGKEPILRVATVRPAFRNYSQKDSSDHAARSRAYSSVTIVSGRARSRKNEVEASAGSQSETDKRIVVFGGERSYGARKECPATVSSELILYPAKISDIRLSVSREVWSCYATRAL